MDTLANALNTMKVAERKGVAQTRITSPSSLVREVLTIMKAEGYVTEFEYVDDGKGGFITVKLAGKINNCGAVKPRFAVKKIEWEKFEQRYLPAKGVGMLVISTPKGLVTNVQAKEKKTGGRLLCYVY